MKAFSRLTGYKLTRADRTTYGGCTWGEGVKHTASGEGPLCSAGWIHYYSSPLLAEFLDSIHGNYGKDALLWEVEASGRFLDDCGLKMGATELTTLRIVERHHVTTEQRVRFEILCVLEVYTEGSFVSWAYDWLSGKDRSGAAAREAAKEAWGVVPAAWAAAEEAEAVREAVREARAKAAEAAREAARATEWAAAAARGALDLEAIAEKAVNGGERL